MNGLSLCAGAGGLELGLAIALPGYRCVGYVERDAFAAAVLMARMEDQALDLAPIWDDLATFDGAAWRGCVDLISAGFPCQPWSAAGKRRGTADDRWIWPDVARIIRDVEPGYVFLENVPTLLHGGIEYVLRDLAALGFAAEWGCFKASDVGASHKRERLFILAHARGRGLGVQSLARPQRGHSASSPADWATLADANGERQPQRCGTLATRSEHASAECESNPVADANGNGRAFERGIGELSESGHIPRGNDVDGCGGARSVVADAESRRKDGVKGTDEPAWSSAERRIPTLADATSSRRRASLRDDEAGQSDAIGFFPPGPRELNAWARILAIEPSLEPAILRNSDGLASRLDRLRTIGNGVVPLAAAYAFRSLQSRLPPQALVTAILGEG